MITVERITTIDDATVGFLKKNFTGADWEWDVEHLKTFVESRILLVAKDGDAGCGVLRAHILPRYDSKGAEILLNEIDTLPTYQRQGVATILIEALKRIAKEIHASEIWVPTNHSNTAAINLYQKCGFVTSDKKDDLILWQKF